MGNPVFFSNSKNYMSRSMAPHNTIDLDKPKTKNVSNQVLHQDSANRIQLMTKWADI